MCMYSTPLWIFTGTTHAQAQTRTYKLVWRVADFGTPIPKYHVFIKHLPSGFRDLGGTGGIKTVRARGDG